MKSKIGNLILLLLPVLFLIVLFTQKDKLTNLVSSEMKLQTGTEVKASIQKLVDSLYNYQSNNESYGLTFLEFGAKGCVACRKMEFVLDEVRQTYPAKVKVVFLNILQPQNQDMMKYYGIVAIPTQVLLDENGEEYFRHTGFYSFEDLSKEFEIN
ncbi:MAG: hypothetical protein C0591_10460 [Marinilabiliales bacterium]|nr:MAG: hypothetical protein C0591_10460 [Marinilabiliales bacterium]